MASFSLQIIWRIHLFESFGEYSFKFQWYINGNDWILIGIMYGWQCQLWITNYDKRHQNWISHQYVVHTQNVQSTYLLNTILEPCKKKLSTNHVTSSKIRNQRTNQFRNLTYHVMAFKWNEQRRKNCSKNVDGENEKNPALFFRTFFLYYVLNPNFDSVAFSVVSLKCC